MRLGPQVCGTLAESALREWLVTDGLGGYAMGTVCGLRTRRYHGLLVSTTALPGDRMLGLASLDATVVVDGRRTALATHEWESGAVQPTGHVHLISFEVADGAVVWRWQIGDVVIERTIAMAHGRNIVAVTHHLIAGPAPVTLELEALCTWRSIHSERRANGTPMVEAHHDGFTFDRGFRLRAEGFAADGRWYLGVHHREEAERGLAPNEDLWLAGRVVTSLEPGGTHGTTAWGVAVDGGGVGDVPGSHPATVIIPTSPTQPTGAEQIISAAADRTAQLVGRARPSDRYEAQLVRAADRFVVTAAAGTTVIAGYPWFGDWSRDTMISIEGLLLETGRHAEAAEVLRRAATSLSEGMLANTADGGTVSYNTVDAALWFVHAVDRCAARANDPAGDLRRVPAMLDAMVEVVTRYRDGTRFGIRVDPSDGLVTQGEEGWALTWMDARLPESAVTPRIGKPVEINALWINALTVVIEALRPTRSGSPVLRNLVTLRDRANASFRRFIRDDGPGLLDVIDGPGGDDRSIRPNQLLAVSLPHAPLRGAIHARMILRACAPLLTPLGLRSLHPDDPVYRGRHRGDVRARDRAYHQGTVWPWLIGPFVDTCLVADDETSRRLASSALGPLLDHLDDWGLGSVSETADGDPPHAGTGCPFQAWSVAELFRAVRAEARHPWPAVASNGAHHQLDHQPEHQPDHQPEHQPDHQPDHSESDR